MDFAGPHRAIRQFEHTQHGRQNRGSAGWNGTRRSRRSHCFLDKAAMEGAEPWELKV